MGAVVVGHRGMSVVAVTDAGEMTQRTPPRRGEHRGGDRLGACEGAGGAFSVLCLPEALAEPCWRLTAVV